MAPKGFFADKSRPLCSVASCAGLFLPSTKAGSILLEVLVTELSKDVVLEKHISLQSEQDEEEKGIPEHYIGRGSDQLVGDNGRTGRWQFWQGLQSRLVLDFGHDNSSQL